MLQKYCRISMKSLLNMNRNRSFNVKTQCSLSEVVLNLKAIYFLKYKNMNNVATITLMIT